jgi:hypothetical protein
MDKTMDNLPPAPGLDGVRVADEPSSKYIKARPGGRAAAEQSLNDHHAFHGSKRACPPQHDRPRQLRRAGATTLSDWRTYGVARQSCHRPERTIIAMSATWSTLLTIAATGTVAVIAAAAPTLYESKTDRIRRSADKGERRRDEKRLAFVAFLRAAGAAMDNAAGALGVTTLVAAGATISPGEESTDFPTMRNAFMAITNAAMEVELLSSDELLRSEVAQSARLTVEMMTAILIGHSDAEGKMREFGDRLATIRTRMAYELAAE